MGNNIFGADISGQLLEAFDDAGAAFDMTLIKRPAGTRDGADPGGGTHPNKGQTTCKGFEVAYVQSLAQSASGVSTGQRTKARSRTIAIYGDSLAGGTVVPASNDVIKYLGIELTISAVKSDPDRALYLCEVRG